MIWEREIRAKDAVGRDRQLAVSIEGGRCRLRTPPGEVADLDDAGCKSLIIALNNARAQMSRR